MMMHIGKWVQKDKRVQRIYKSNFTCNIDYKVQWVQRVHK